MWADGDPVHMRLDRVVSRDCDQNGDATDHETKDGCPKKASVRVHMYLVQRSCHYHYDWRRPPARDDESERRWIHPKVIEIGRLAAACGHTCIQSSPRSHVYVTQAGKPRATNNDLQIRRSSLFGYIVKRAFLSGHRPSV
jgi:hypothetical protein